MRSYSKVEKFTAICELASAAISLVASIQVLSRKIKAKRSK